MKKRFLSILLTGMILALMLPVSTFADNSCSISIRLTPDVGEAGQAAADVLGDYLEKITGTRPALTDTDEEGATIALRLAPDGQG